MKPFSKLIFILFLILSNLAHSEEILFQLKANKLSYNDKKSIITAAGKAEAWDNQNRKIYADKIVYNKKDQKILAYGNSKFVHEKILITAREFNYNLNEKKIEAQYDVVLKDQNNNIYNLKKATFFELKKISFGENVFAKINDGSSFKADFIKTDHIKGLSFYNNSYYTTCKKINNDANEYCPSWSLNSKKIIHDKELKKVIHKNSVIRIKKIPIFYTPYFSHPDPTVKRQSGFLTPAVKTVSNLGKTLKLPYFFAIDDDKDLTVTPIYYFQQKNMLNTSYRQAIKNGFLQVETSYSGGYKNTETNNNLYGSRNYFFLKYEKNLEKNNFSDSSVKFNLQRVSQKNYLRVNNLKTKLFDSDQRILNNNINYLKISNNKKIEVRSSILENLDETNDKKKYTYILPEVTYSAYNKINKDFNIKFSSISSAKKYLDTQEQVKITNIASINSKQYVNKFGIGSRYTFELLNTNVHNNNVENEKENYNLKNYFTIIADNSLPLLKKNFETKVTHVLTPRIYAKYTSGNSINSNNTSKILEINDIFSINRSNNITKPETGLSFGHGIDYSYKKQKIDNSMKIKSQFGLGQVIKTKRDDNMPAQSSLQNISSDFVGFANYSFFGKKNIFFDESELNQSFQQNYFNFGYKFTLNNDFKKLLRNEIDINTIYESYSVKFNFDEKNSYIGSDRFLTGQISKYLDQNYFFYFSNTRNLITNGTKNQKLSFNYEDDCLLTSIAINRDFYNDEEINSNKSIFFNIVFKPFGDSIAPDLSSLIK